MLQCLFTGSQCDDDHTGVQMTNDVSESVLRIRDVVSVGDDTRASSPETSLEQQNVIINILRDCKGNCIIITCIPSTLCRIRCVKYYVYFP